MSATIYRFIRNCYITRKAEIYNHDRADLLLLLRFQSFILQFTTDTTHAHRVVSYQFSIITNAIQSKPRFDKKKSHKLNRNKSVLQTTNVFAYREQIISI